MIFQAIAIAGLQVYRQQIADAKLIFCASVLCI